MTKRLHSTLLALCAAAVLLGGTASAAAQAGDPAERAADWVKARGDNDGLPYAVVDKVAARVLVFDADGRLLGETPALLGAARGDRANPWTGDRELSDLRPEEKTTPAGRFRAGLGRNLAGREVLWVDYDTATSLHPVLTSRPEERRLQRLASATPADNRISNGCINVPAAFFRQVVRPAFAERGGVVYVLPETRPTRAMLKDGRRG